MMPFNREQDARDESANSPVTPAFFARHPTAVARDLIGRFIVTRSSEGIAGGVIVETEAYLGEDDPGSHAATRTVTARNAVMYGAPGTVYVYLSYGCHHMLNLVSHEQGEAGAVLIRAIEPRMGVDLMSARRGVGTDDVSLCNGPGKLCSALGIDQADNKSALGSGRVAVYDGERTPPGEIGMSGRVGLSAGHEPEYRYYLEKNPYVSRGRVGPPRTRAAGES